MIKLRELYYITHVNNLPSILEKGILSHRRIEEEEKIQPTAVYDTEIIEKRKDVKTPSNKSLWDFANLYFQPRNAMLFLILKEENINDIIIIGFDSNSILKRSDIFITTGNAASQTSKILPTTKDKIEEIRRKTDKEWWADEDGSKRELMAECLVPDSIPPKYIKEIYVATHTVMHKTKSKIGSQKIPIIPEPSLFFEHSRKIELTKNLSLVEGDMFFSRMQTLTVSVNTVGVMGKGLASRAKYQFPDVYVFYQDLCKEKNLEMGKPYLYKRETSLNEQLTDEPQKLFTTNSGTWFLLFPTKRHWKESGDIKGVEDGLKWIVNNYRKEGIKSLAIPSLGCGLGQLEWRNIGPLCCKYLQHLDILVELYLPVEEKIPDDQLSKDFLLES